MKFISTICSVLLAVAGFAAEAVFTGLPNVAVTNISTRMDGPALLGRASSDRGRIQQISGTALVSILSTANTVPQGTNTLTDGGTNSLFTVALATNKSVGIKFTSTVTATDGTDFQSKTEDVMVDAVSKNGVFTTYVYPVGSTNGAASTGTLTTSYQATATGTTLTVKVAANSSLTSTNTIARWKIYSVFTDGAGTVTPQ